MASRGEREEAEKMPNWPFEKSAIGQKFNSAPIMDVLSGSFQSAAYFWVEQRTVFFRWIKRGEEVKHINTTSHSAKNIETFIFEGTLGPFLECGGFNPRHS